MLDKQKSLEWISFNGFGAKSLDYTLTSFRDALINNIQSGTFDTPTNNHLREALERIRKIVKEAQEAKYHVNQYELIEKIADKALNTEPTVDRARELPPDQMAILAQEYAAAEEQLEAEREWKHRCPKLGEEWAEGKVWGKCPVCGLSAEKGAEGNG